MFVDTNRGAPDGGFYYPDGYGICRISEKIQPDYPAGYRVFYSIIVNMNIKLNDIIIYFQILDDTQHTVQTPRSAI